MMNNEQRRYEIVMMVSMIGQLYRDFHADYEGSPARWKIWMNSDTLFTGTDKEVHTYLTGAYDLTNSILYHGYEMRVQRSKEAHIG